MQRMGAWVKRNPWDSLALLLFLLVLVLILVNISMFPVYLDMPYHLAASQAFIRSGGVVTWDWWEFAPAGRPHIYPPFLHVMMSVPLQLGISEQAVGTFFSLIMFPLMMLSMWWMVRRLFGQRQAFYSALLLLIPYTFFWQTAVTSAAALVLVFTPLIFLTLERKRWVTPAILLAACLYAHLVMGHLVALALVIYLLHRRDQWRGIVKVLAAAYLLYLPWGINIALHFSSFSTSEPGGGASSIHLFIWLAALLALPLCYLKKGRYYLLSSYFLSMIPIVFFYPNRFWEGHVFLPLAMLGGLFLNTLHDGLKHLFASQPDFARRARQLAAVSLGIIMIPLLLIDPVVAWGGSKPANLAQGTLPGGPYAPGNQAPPLAGARNITGGGDPLRLTVRYTTPLNLLGLEDGQDVRLESRGAMFSEENLELCRVIEELSSQDEVVFVSDARLADLIFAETGRPVSDGMFHEVQSEEKTEPRQAGIIVAPVGNGAAGGGPGGNSGVSATAPKAGGGAPAAALNALEANLGEPAARVGQYVVFVNDRATASAQPAAPALPLWAAYLILALAGMLIFLDQFLYLKRRRSGGGGGDDNDGETASDELVPLETAPQGAAQPSLLVAVPCLNEAGNIGQVVREIRYHAPGARVLVVDDGSGDATAEAARAEGAAVLVNRRNLGIGASLKRAFALALSSGHARLVRMDGDGQHDPAYLSALLQPLEAGEADVVIGSRYLAGGAEGDGSTTSLRRGSRKLFALLVQVYTGRRFSDPNSGMWAYSRPAMGFLAHADLFDYPEGDMLIALQRAGFRVVEVPVRMRPRRAGRSSLSLASALSYLLQVGLHPIFDPDTRPGSGLSQYSPSPLP